MNDVGFFLSVKTPPARPVGGAYVSKCVLVLLDDQLVEGKVGPRTLVRRGGGILISILL